MLLHDPQRLQPFARSIANPQIALRIHPDNRIQARKTAEEELAEYQIEVELQSPYPMQQVQLMT
jgi:hypothetical protein